jgi:hypothetical protein
MVQQAWGARNEEPYPQITPITQMDKKHGITSGLNSASGILLQRNLCNLRIILSAD